MTPLDQLNHDIEATIVKMRNTNMPFDKHRPISPNQYQATHYASMLSHLMLSHDVAGLTVLLSDAAYDLEQFTMMKLAAGCDNG